MCGVIPGRDATIQYQLNAMSPFGAIQAEIRLGAGRSSSTGRSINRKADVARARSDSIVASLTEPSGKTSDRENAARLSVTAAQGTKFYQPLSRSWARSTDFGFQRAPRLSRTAARRSQGPNKSAMRCKQRRQASTLEGTIAKFSMCTSEIDEPVFLFVLPSCCSGSAKQQARAVTVIVGSCRTLRVSAR